MKPDPLSPSKVVSACLDAPNDGVWMDFVRCFQPIIASGILKVVRQQSVQADPSLVDDLIQDTYLKLVKDRCRLLRDFKPQGEESICAFVKVVAINMARDHVSAQKTLKRGAGLLDEDAMAEAVTSPDAMERELLLAEVAGHLEQMVESPRDRDIFWMHYRQGFSAREIAELPGLDLTVKGVESCLFRLTRQLKTVLDPKILLAGNGNEMKPGSDPVRGSR